MEITKNFFDGQVSVGGSLFVIDDDGTFGTNRCGHDVPGCAADDEHDPADLSSFYLTNTLTIDKANTIISHFEMCPS